MTTDQERAVQALSIATCGTTILVTPLDETLIEARWAEGMNDCAIVLPNGHVDVYVDDVVNAEPIHLHIAIWNALIDEPCLAGRTIRGTTRAI